MRTIVVLATVFPTMLILATPAFSHSFYDPMCCSDKDCMPVPASEIKATKNGWYIVRTGETVPYKNPNVKHSPDGQFHRCTISGDFSPRGHTLCLYVPDELN